MNNSTEKYLSKRLGGIAKPLIWLAIIGAILSQSYYLTVQTITPRIAGLARIGDEPAWYRSAHRLQGEEFANYIEFLRNKIPEEAMVLLPPHQHQFGPFQHVTFMQYFLFPRSIINCGVNEVPACLDRIRYSSDLYILDLRDFPPDNFPMAPRVSTPFRDELGVYPPALEGQR